MKRLPWLEMRKKTDPELPLEPPIWFGNQSNGEYFRPATKKDRKMRKLILETCDENARKLGMDRRDFLASAMGMATTLSVISAVSACSSDDAVNKDAGHAVPKDAGLDRELACAVIGGDEFIFDVQTHWFKKDDLANFPAYLQLFGQLFDRTTETEYVKNMFLESDTTVAALTAWPGIACTGQVTTNCGLPLSNESNAASRDHINDSLAHHTQRVVNHVQVMVQDTQGIDYELAIMEAAKNTYGVAAWKMYPGFQPIFKMDDDRGRAVIQKGLDLGVPLFCVHKGLPIGTFFSVEGNHPRDVGVVAKDYPEARFMIYHSAICAGSDSTANAPPEGPYDPNEADPKGVNALIRSLEDNGIGPNQNVFGEVGSALNQVQKDPVVAAHFFGKLMKYVGTDNVLWGTDCIIYGSPQPFIEWFRTLTIPQSMMDTYGYPALDDAQKAKILGLNAAKVYGLDPHATRCRVEQTETALLKRRLDHEFGTRRWAFQEPSGPRTWDEFVQHSRDCVRLGRPG
ncbi:MAG TPA: amidohydrolase family protein [Polyangiaceae bacterium]|nr:amidohydrolase family protein [Polyangiaceae bacterium]